MTIPEITWTPEFVSTADFYGEEFPDRPLTHDTLDDFMGHLIAEGELDPDCADDMSEPVKVFGYDIKALKREHCEFLDGLLEDLDERYGTDFKMLGEPGPIGENVMVELREIEKTAADLLLNHYKPQAVEPVAQINVNFGEWWAEQSQAVRDWLVKQ